MNYDFGFKVSYIDVTSNFAGSLMGVSQTVANSCGFIVPAVVGAIVTNEVYKLIKYVLYLSLS